jgi:DNA repair protein RadC
MRGALGAPLSGGIVHNDPSDVSDPSTEDVEFTRLLAKAGKLLGIRSRTT